MWHSTVQQMRVVPRCVLLQVHIYMDRGLSEPVARMVAEELTAKDVVRAHARDELVGGGVGGGGGRLTSEYQAALNELSLSSQALQVCIE